MGQEQVLEQEQVQEQAPYHRPNQNLPASSVAGVHPGQKEYVEYEKGSKREMLAVIAM